MIIGRKGEVLRALRHANGEWVGGPALANAAVGGSEGLRRVRALRYDHGYNIEKKKLEGHNYFSYRLVEYV